MKNPWIVWELKGNIGYITINRVDALNSLNKTMLNELETILKTLKENDACRGIIITGAGDKAFSAGADVNTFLEEIAKPFGGKEWSRYGQRVFNILEHIGKPSVAAINGLAVGGGLELALACTFRIATEKAVFGFPEISLGFLPGWGGTARLTRLIGKAKASELILTGDRIDAKTALKIGLLDKLVSSDELISSSEELLRKIIRHSPIAIKVALEAIHYAQYLSLEESLVLESNLGGLACYSEDAKEGLRAFLEKRKPVFKGR